MTYKCEPVVKELAKRWEGGPSPVNCPCPLHVLINVGVVLYDLLKTAMSMGETEALVEQLVGAVVGVTNTLRILTIQDHATWN